MINVQLSRNKGYKWFTKENLFVKGFIFTPDNKLLREESLLTYFSCVYSFDDFQTKIRQANGLFSIIIKKENTLWATVDSTRAFPLFYYHNNESMIITDNPEELKSHQIPDRKSVV